MAYVSVLEPSQAPLVAYLSELEASTVPVRRVMMQVHHMLQGVLATLPDAQEVQEVL